MSKRRTGWTNDKAAENGKSGGRPAGTIGEEKLARITVKRKFVKFVEDNVDKILAAQLDLALGVYEQKEDALTGAIKIYKRKPDGFALSQMIDQVIGRAPQKIEVEAEIEVTRNLSDDERLLVTQGLRMALPAYVLNENKSAEDANTPTT